MFARLVRALRHRNYRLFFGGQTVSLVGTWITRIATSWLVYRLTGSELLLGVVAFAGQVPLLVLSSFAGVLADRWNRRRLLVVTQALSALQSLVLAVLAFTHITVTEIILLQIAQGIINAFDTPARQAFVVEMVDSREDLPNAIALNSSMFNASRLIGPSIGGFLIAVAGEGWCFLVDAISYVAVILSLLAMRFTRPVVIRPRSRMLEELRSGVSYAFGFPPVRALLADVAIVGTFGMMYTTLAPVIASKVLHGGAHTLGILMTASGLGALLGTVYLATRHTVVGLGRVIVAANLALSLALAAFAFAHYLWVALLVLPVIGAGMMLQASSAQTILQTVVSENLRGRVIAFYSVAVLGTQPLGSLLAGVLGARIGTQNTILFSAAVCLAASIWFAFRRPALSAHIRPIYMELGILPGVDPVVVEE